MFKFIHQAAVYDTNQNLGILVLHQGDMIERHGSMLTSMFLLVCATFTITKVLTVVKNEVLQLNNFICYDFDEVCDIDNIIN